MGRRKRVVNRPAAGTERDGLVEFERGSLVRFPDMQTVALAGPAADRRMYIISVDVPFFGRSQLTILLDPKSETRRPQVFVADPRPMRHQFDSGSICMWYEFDPPEKRWVFGDGLVALADLASVHLYREERYRETGCWMGEEAPHGLPFHPGSPSREGKR